MSTPTRLANKTQWTLDDIVALCQDAQPAWRSCQELAEQRQEPRLLAGLGRLRDALARIETLAREARQGRYAGK